MACANDASVNMLGNTGLNTIPSARMDEHGTVRIGVSTLDPYNHAFVGMQVTPSLYVNLRQSMLASSVLEKPDLVYPGMDLKIRLQKESRYTPEIAFGLDSLLGHRRFSSEYFTLSKRFWNVDFTSGVGWGRMGSGGTLPNPFGRLSSHFREDRDFNSEDAAGPGDLFTGKNIGLFAGAEYFTPLQGLSLKADIGGYRAPGEKTALDFDEPSLWSVGLSYTPRSWINLGLSLVGGDKVMARLSFQNNAFHWDRKSYKETSPGRLDKRPASTTANKARDMAGEADIGIGRIITEGTEMRAVVYFNDYQPTALQVGRAARLLHANAAAKIETLTVIPVHQNLRGNAVSFSRRDFEKAASGHGSPEEIWLDTSFSQSEAPLLNDGKKTRYRIIPHFQASISEEETTHLYRLSVLAQQRRQMKYGFQTGNDLRLNIADRLHSLEKFRMVGADSVRSDADRFTYNRVNLDRSFLSWMATPITDVHVAVTAGYLEEMYAGTGGEILYRPFQSPFAIGVEAWNVRKRIGETFGALGLMPNSVTTGHINLFYEVPDSGMTFYAKAGRYLGGDLGATAGVKTALDNGMTISGFVTATNTHDKDAFGADRNVYAGLQMTIPLAGISFLPQGSAALIDTAPIGRDAGQLLDKPVSLYDATEPMSYRRLGQSWQEVLN